MEHAPDERLTISSQQFRCLKEFAFYSFAYGGGLEMLFLQDAMPELRRIRLSLRTQETESKMGFEFSFEHLASLEDFIVEINRDKSTRVRVEAAEAAVRNAVSIHPGHPTLNLRFFGYTLEDKGHIWFPPAFLAHAFRKRNRFFEDTLEDKGLRSSISSTRIPKKESCMYEVLNEVYLQKFFYG